MEYKLQPYTIQELGKRDNQEDSLFPANGRSTISDRLFILCDGMGGHEHGEVASQTVCEVMSNTILQDWKADQPLPDTLLQYALEKAYDALDAKDAGEEKKMGTTLTFVCFHSQGVTVAHIGDSRVYQIRPATKKENASIVFKTRDHSLVNALVDIGEITEEEAINHPQKNVITRAMQPCQENRAKADIAHLTDIRPGDYFYMCSDGMLEQTSDDNLLFMIAKKDSSDLEKVEMLRNVTADNKDNHTAHLIYVKDVKGQAPQSEYAHIVAGAPTPTQAVPQRKRSILPYLLAFVLLAGAGASAYFMFNQKEEKDSSDKDAVEQFENAIPEDDNTIHHPRRNSLEDMGNEVFCEEDYDGPRDRRQEGGNKPKTEKKESGNKEKAKTTDSSKDKAKESDSKDKAKESDDKGDKQKADGKDGKQDADNKQNVGDKDNKSNANNQANKPSAGSQDKPNAGNNDSSKPESNVNSTQPSGSQGSPQKPKQKTNEEKVNKTIEKIVNSQGSQG